MHNRCNNNVYFSDALGLVLLGRKRSDHQPKSKVSMKDRVHYNRSAPKLGSLLDFLVVGRLEQLLESVLVSSSDTWYGQRVTERTVYGKPHSHDCRHNQCVTLSLRWVSWLECPFVV